MRTTLSTHHSHPARSSSGRARRSRTLGTTVGTLTALSLASLIAIGSACSSAAAQSLRGSRRAVNKPYHYATLHDLPFSRTSRDVKRSLHEGYLVRLGASPDYVTHDVSFPYVTRTTLTFVRRLAAQYHRGCGEKLVITSAVRPESMQPTNSSEYSVHPAGIAVDFRKPRNSACLKWLRRNLLIIEKRGDIEATEEHHPAHFHVVVIPESYKEYLAAR
ncbi:MAG TPA: DUF5715 family protein [Gemmatimonadaceae bacterium]|nr:DUF5715 family protein [Gemmatimonadaceae bacterium]